MYLFLAGKLDYVGGSFTLLCRPFMIFEGCLDTNPQCCRRKLARYQLSHPYLSLSQPSLFFKWHLLSENILNVIICI